MSLLKKATAAILSMILSLCLWAPVLATDYGVDTRATAAWLREKVPQPSVGNERVVLALLRGAYITPQQDYTTIYLNALQQHINSGAAATQPVEDSYWQAMVLAACGLDLAVAAPSLLDVFTQNDTLDLKGRRMALQLFSSNPGIAEAAGADLAAAEAAVVAGRNQDGGYGEGESNAIDTARTVQALAAREPANGTEQALLDSLAWLYMRPNDEGGFDMNGAPSATATAEVMIALSCCGENPDLLSSDAASLSSALLYFSKGNGSFSETEDGEADISTTAICMLGLASKVRYDRDLSSIYNFEDIPPYTSPASSPASSVQPESIATVEKPSGGSSLLVPVLVAFFIIAAAIAILVALQRSSRKNKSKRKPPRGY